MAQEGNQVKLLRNLRKSSHPSHGIDRESLQFFEKRQPKKQPPTWQQKQFLSKHRSSKTNSTAKRRGYRRSTVQPRRRTQYNQWSKYI